MTKPNVRAAKVALVAGVLSASALAPVASSQAATPAPGGARTAAAVGTYSPQTGLIYNNPLRRAYQQVIMNHIVRTMRSVPPGGVVRMSDWNVQSDRFVNVAKETHDRGVTVQILMSGGVAKRQSQRTGSYWQLNRYFKAHPHPGQPSFMRWCVSSCRGNTGIEHSKFVLASSAGTSSNVVMVSSANLTGIAGANQWNDIFTLTGNAGMYAKYVDIFRKMTADRIDRPMYQTSGWSGGFQAFFNPHPSQNDGDPVLGALRGVRCGRAGAAGINGRTVIRVAQTAISGQRGIRIANRLGALGRQGCNIKVAYTLLGNNVRSALGRIPVRQVTKDNNRDGYYDKYLHTKLLTISGNIGGRSNQYFFRNGSENWNPTAFQSDETGFNVRNRPGYTRAYSRYINWMFSMGHRGVQAHPVDRGVDPYANVQID